MSALTFAALVFMSIFLAALAGVHMQRVLPEKFTDDATEGHVKAVLGMLSMMTAVVLGFVTANAKNSFDNASKIVADTAVRMVSIDRTLADFGDEGESIRVRLKKGAEEWIGRIKSPAGDANTNLRAVQRAEELESFVASIQKLKPASEVQAEAQGRVVEQALGILHDRWVLKTDREGSTPTVFLLVLLAWLGLEFFIFGLFAARNAAIVFVTFFGSVMVASAFFLVLDLEGPMTGPMRVGTGPLERAVAIMGQ
jgi:hypothetical protein